MKKIGIALVVIVILFLGYKLSSPKRMGQNGVSDAEASLLLFWGDGCPHCKIVEEYISTNQVNQKIKIAYKEVYYNKTNQNLLQETVKKCPEIDSAQGIGVPLAYSKQDNKCFYGDTPIIEWLKAEMLK